MEQRLAAELAVVREVVLAAGAILLASLDDVGPIARKSATELVTALDTRVEDRILSRLSRVFPGDHLVAEESGCTAGHNARTWYIDPLDGTTNYAHGYPLFAVSVACVDAQGLAVAGVYAPYLDELYLASRRGGAVLERPHHGEQRMLGPRTPVALPDALLATGFPYLRDDGVDRNADILCTFLKAQCHGVRRGGSAAMDLVHVAAGKLDGYWEASLRPWDTAGGTLVAREAGALVTSYQGVTEDLHFKNIMAAAPSLHQVMGDIIGSRGGRS